MHTNTTGRSSDRQSKLEYRIVNVYARSIFSERHLTMESAEARLAEFREYGIGTENLEVFVTAPPEGQWFATKSGQCEVQADTP